MKGKIKLPAGFKYRIDHESGDATPVVECENKGTTIVDKAKQIFYLPIERSGNILPLSYTWQLMIDKIEINFIYRHQHDDSLAFERIFISDYVSHAIAKFHHMPDDEEFAAQVNRFTKPKRLAFKILKELYEDSQTQINNNMPSRDAIRQIYFYLLNKHERIADKKIIQITENFRSRLEFPSAIKTAIYNRWYELRAEHQKDGTVK